MAKKLAKKPIKYGKDRLGAGIGAIFNKDLEDKIEENPEEAIKELSHTVAEIPLDTIEVNPNQPRNHFDEELLNELAESIKVHGLIQPITVRRLSPNEFQLISGERRWRASKMAGLTEIPAYIRIANDQEMLEMALIENIQREDLNAIEIAITYQRLKEECNLTDEKLAERVGKKRETITNYIRLLTLPSVIQTSVKNKEISMGHARALAGLNDNIAIQLALLKRAREEKLSVRKLEELAQRAKSPVYSSPKRSSLPDNYRNVQQAFREFFGSGKVAIKLKKEGKGQIIIPFDTTGQLNDLLDRIDEK